MDLAPLGEEPTVYDVYRAEAAMLAHLSAPQTTEALRKRLAPQPELLALLDASEGRISRDELMKRIGEDKLDLAPHAWFALAVHAVATGADARPLFAKAAARALDRQFPYRVARAYAARSAE